MVETTEKSKEYLRKAAMTAKRTAIDNINKEYNDILLDLVKYDTAKVELEKSTTATIESL